MAASVRFQGSCMVDATKPNGQMRRRLCVERARAELGFEAKVGLGRGFSGRWLGIGRMGVGCQRRSAR